MQRELLYRGVTEVLESILACSFLFYHVFELPREDLVLHFLFI